MSAEQPFQICDLPSSHISYASDPLTYLRGARATTFTHWTKLKAEPGAGAASHGAWPKLLAWLRLSAAQSPLRCGAAGGDEE